jgi:hypothetical protein
MLSKYLNVLALSTLLSSIAFIALLAPNVQGQADTQTVDSNGSLQRGYRTGYSDGYMSGYRDTIDGVAKDYFRHSDYKKADRAYNKDHGSIDDYRDGYQQGFESGYDTGFERRSFQSSLPSALTKRGTVDSKSPTAESSLEAKNETTADESSNSEHEKIESAEGSSDSTTQTETPAPQIDPATEAKFRSTGEAVYLIPRDTELVLALDQELNTKTTREGDRFTAKIVSPTEIAGATIEGHITKVRTPGKIKGRSELLLSFDRILLTNERWANISAVLIEVLPLKGDNVLRVDTEGTAVGKSSTKSDVKKVGVSTGAGVAVGAIVGGPVGAAVGAGIGAAVGVGAVVIDRGKHINLTRSQQLRIKTAYETQIR